jgi:hypothetical protein
VLVEAAYEPGQWVRLTFDQAVNVDGVGLGAFAVTVGDGGEADAEVYLGAGTPTLITPETVQIDLSFAGMQPGPAGVLLTVSGESGIVGANAPVTFPGVTDLSLPYP